MNLEQIRKWLSQYRNHLLALLAVVIVGFAAGVISNFKLPPPPSTSEFEIKAACTSTRGLRVELSWDLSFNVTMNRLERRAGETGVFETIFEEKTKPFDTFEYTDTSVENGKTYFYRLMAYKDVASTPIQVQVTPDRCRETLE